MADNLLIHPNGELYTVPDGSMPDAMQAGYQVPTPEQVTDFKNKSVYGGAAGLATAGAAGLLEGSLPFAGDYIAKNLGPGTAEENAESIRQSKKQHPIANIAGQIAGIAADPVGVWGLLGNGTELATKAVETASEKLGAGALGDVAAHAAGGGLQGAGFGAANVSNDYALGDPSLTAEKAISEVGFSALLGGAIGTTAHELGHVASGAASATKEGLSKAVDLFDDEGPLGGLKQSAIRKFAEASSLVNGKPVDEIVDMIQNAQIREPYLAKDAAKGILNDIGVVAAGKMLGLPKMIMGPAVGLYSALQEPAVAMRKLVKLQDLIGGTSEIIAKGAKSLVNASPISAQEALGFTGAKLSQDKYNDVSDRIRDLAGNPSALVEHMSRQFGALSAYAPAVANQANMTGAAGITFLANKLPPKPMASPLETPPEASPSEVFKFSQYYNAVENPLDILKHAKNGTLTGEQIEAVATVYPKLFGEMQKSLMSEVINKKNANKIPYQHKMMLSMLLGQNSDKSMEPMSVMSNQIALGVAQQQQSMKDAAFAGAGKQQKTRVSGLNKMSLSNRSLTPLQMANQRTK